MAHKESGAIAPGQSYVLGNYTFRTAAAYDEQTGKTTIYAYCGLTSEGIAKAGGAWIVIDGNASLVSWSVEANDTTADVYATVRVQAQQRLTVGTLDYKEFPAGTTRLDNGHSITVTNDSRLFVIGGQVFAASLSGGSFDISYGAGTGTAFREFSNNNKVVYYAQHPSVWNQWNAAEFDIPVISVVPANGAWAAWDIYYASGDSKMKNILIGRFAIELDEAGGTGGDSDWDDPGDSGDPMRTLQLVVTGALSGRHNDPLNDTSYSYIPSDQDAVARYGCGGAGGHGGGGGAGASTVVIQSFTTSRAGSKDEIAIAQRHGYGSGGGKGGKGGDGCILIYY